MNPLLAWLTTLAAVLSAIAATASWRSAANANNAAKQLAQIETDRRHTELTPEFRLTARGSADGAVILNVKLVGPTALAGLRSLTVWVRDDSHDPPIPFDIHDDITPEEIAGVIWGPYRFRDSVDGASPDGRRPAVIALDLGNDRDFIMDLTHAPRWASDGGNTYWASRYEMASIRLKLVCEADGHQVWVVPLEVYPPRRPQIFT